MNSKLLYIVNKRNHLIVWPLNFDIFTLIYLILQASKLVNFYQKENTFSKTFWFTVLHYIKFCDKCFKV